MRRLSIITLALVAGLGGAGLAAAAKSKKKSGKHRTPVAKVVTVTCKIYLTDQPPSNDTVYTPGVGSGTQFGKSFCDKYFNAGVQASDFATGDSGDTTGNIRQFYSGGSVMATYNLTPADESSPSPKGTDTTSTTPPTTTSTTTATSPTTTTSTSPTPTSSGTSSTTPSSSPNAFSAQDYTGTITLTDATGIFKGEKGKKAGTYDCHTDDAVHFACVETVTLIEPVPAKR